jgi:hypothetical protein
MFPSHLLFPINVADLVEGGDGGGEPPVHAEHALVDQGRQGQVVKDVRAVPAFVCWFISIETVKKEMSKRKGREEQVVEDARVLVD